MSNTSNNNKIGNKLWTGKTPRQELFERICINAIVNDFPVNDALESVVDGADRCPDGSIKREMLRWWDTSSPEAQTNLLREAKRHVMRDDRLMGRHGLVR